MSGVKFAQDAALGMRQAASDAGNVSVVISGPPSANPLLAQQQVTTQLTQSPDGYGIDPFTADLWQPTLGKVAAQQKNVVVWNDPPVILPSQVDQAKVNTFVGISNAAFGTYLATQTIKLAALPPTTTGKVLLGQCFPGQVGVLAERNAAFLAVIHQLLPNTTIIQFNSMPDQAANTNAWKAQLLANPNPVLALGGCGQDGVSLDLLKKSLGQQFVAAGIDVTPQSLSGVADGTLTATLATNYYVQGYVTAWLLIQAARGGQSLPQGFIDTGYTLITKDNVAAFQASQSTDDANSAYWKSGVDAIVADVAGHTKPLADAWKQ